jgi:AraC-like DNA-binding protein
VPGKSMYTTRMKIIDRSLIGGFIVLTLFAGRVSAEPVVVDTLFESRTPGMSYQYIEDVSGNLTINDITAGARRSDAWRAAEEDVLNAGFSSSTFWIRFTLSNITDKSITVFIEETFPLLSEISLFYPTSPGLYEEMAAGARYEFSKRPVMHPSFVFPVTIEARGNATIYIRVRSSGSIIVPLKIHSQSKFFESYIHETILYWIMYGMIILLLLYNIILFIILREESYLDYGVFLTAFTLLVMSLNGHAHQYLWPNSPWWNAMCRPMLLGIVVASLCQFFRRFVDIRHYSRIGDSMVVTIILVSILVAASTFVFGSYRMSMLMAVFLAIIGLTLTGILALYLSIVKRSRQVILLMVSFLMFCLGALLFLLKSLGILPQNPVTNNFLLVGGIIQTILFSLAIGDSLKTLKDDLQSLNLHVIGLTNKKNRIITPAIKEKMDKAIVYLEENFRSPISREGLAAHIDIHSDDFGRYFKLYTGKKVNDYWNELRVVEASRIIRESEDQFSDIAFAVGFESLATFNRAFLKVMEVTPSRYKEINKGIP